jgi:hypothetical protein
MTPLEAAAVAYSRAKNELLAQAESRSEGAVVYDLPGFNAYQRAKEALLVEAIAFAEVVYAA